MLGAIMKWNSGQYETRMGLSPTRDAHFGRLDFTFFEFMGSAWKGILKAAGSGLIEYLGPS